MGQVRYQQADVAAAEQLEGAVAAAKAAWGVGLAGVFHLAGIGREAPFLEETPETVLPVLTSKVFGTCAIEQLLTHTPDAYCVLFSSAVTTTDTSQTAAYAMANAYLDGWAAVQRQGGRIVHSFNWAPWENLGMNAGWTVSPALRAKGLNSIPVRAGLNSMLAGLTLADARLIIGLDPDNARISSIMHEPKGAAAMGLEGFYARREAQDAAEIRRSSKGTTIDRPILARRYRSFPRLPLTCLGRRGQRGCCWPTVGDREEALKNEVGAEADGGFRPRALGVEVGVNDSFFDLGGC